MHMAAPVTLASPDVVEILLDNVCGRGPALPYPALRARLGAVSRLWAEKLRASLPLLPVLSFRSSAHRVSMTVVETALLATASRNLRVVDLSACAGLSVRTVHCAVLYGRGLPACPSSRHACDIPILFSQMTD